MPEGEIREAGVLATAHKDGKDGHAGNGAVERSAPRERSTSFIDAKLRDRTLFDRVFDERGWLDPDALRSVEAELVDLGSWGELLDLYAVAASRAPDPELGLATWMQAGLLLLEQMDDAHGAEPYFRRVLASDPENLEALDALKTIAIRAGRWEETADILDRIVALSPPDERADLLMQLAVVVDERLHQPDRAILALRQAYESAPSRRDILAEARRIFVAEQRFLEAKNVLDDEAEAVLAARTAAVVPRAAAVEPRDGEGDPDAEVLRIAEAYRQLGVHLIDSAISHPIAEACLERARELGDRDALSKLDDLAHTRKEWEAKAKALRDEALEARDKKRASELYLRAAELYATYGNDPIRADEYLERCLLLVPGYAPALRFIEGTHLERGRAEDLVRRLNAMAGAVKDPAVKVGILLRVARFLERVDPERTDHAPVISAYRRALAIDPGHRAAVSRVAAILSAEGRHADSAQILEAQLAAEKEEYVRTEIHLVLGRVYAEMLGDSTRARAHFEAVLALSPTHFEAASALRALYKDAGELPLLISVLKVLSEYAPDVSARRGLLDEIARVAQDVSREELFSAWRRIFELDPEADGLAARLEELAAALGRWQPLADAYVSAARKRRGTRAAELWIAAARLYESRLPRPGDAITAYKRALVEITEGRATLDPRPVHDALERLLRQQDDPAALVEVLKSQLSRNTDPEQEPLLLMKIGSVLEHDLGDLAGAIEMFRRVLDRQPNNAGALATLDDLYRRRGDHEHLVEILARREKLAENASELAELQCRRARTLDEALDRKDEAAELYLDVLTSFPDQTDVVQALGSLLIEGVSRLPIARALEPIFHQRGQFGRQLDMLSVLIDAEQDVKARRDLARRAAQVAEQRLGSRELAFELIGKALEDDPADEETRETFLRLVSATEEWSTAAQILERVLERTDLQSAAVSTLASALGDLYDGPLEQRSRAIDAYQRALAADGGNVGAVAALERLLGAGERWNELASLFSDRVARSTEKAAKVHLGLALAAIKDQHLRDPDAAIEVYREVLAIEPGEGTALSKLAEVLVRQERWRELVGVLDRMRDASPDPELGAAADVKAGDVMRLRLNDRRGALERYQRALKESPRIAGAIRGLESLLEDLEMRPAAGALLEPHYAEAERWSDLVIALESQLATAAEADRRKLLLFRIADVEIEKLGQAEAAFETLVRAYRESLVDKADRRKLEDAAVAARKARELGRIYEDTLASQPNDVELLRDLARLYDDAAGDVTSARAAWKRLLERERNDREALEALERLHGSGDNPSAFAEILLQRAEATSGPDRVGFLRRASAIFEEAAEDLGRAIAAMERARLETPRDRSIYQELQRLYELVDNPEKLRDALEGESQLIEEAVPRANAFVRFAVVSVRLGALDDAVAAYQAALQAAPEHQVARVGLESLLETPAGAKAALALEPVYRAAGDWENLVEAYELLARDSADSAERVERLLAIRSIWEERLGRSDRAFAAAARAFRERSSSEELMTSLERLARLSGQVEELLGLLEDHADSLPYVSKDRHETRIRVARFTESLLHDRGRAIEAWKRVLEERPDSLVAYEGLERHYTRSGDARELVEVLRTMAGLVDDPAERLGHVRRAALILEEKLGERQQAARVWEHVLTIQRGDLEALRRLDSIYKEARAFPELAQVLAEEVAVARSAEERGVLLLRLGELRRRELGDPRGALSAFSAVLSEGADAGRAYEGALNAAFDLIEHAKGSNLELSSLAAEVIEPHLARRGDHVRLVAAKEARVAALSDPRAKRFIRLEIAAVHEGNDQPEMAFLAVARAFAELPRDADLAAMLERLADAADTQEELADTYAEALPAIDDEALALRVARKAAHVYDVVLSRGESAVPFYEHVLALVPEDMPSLIALERIHRRAGNDRKLVEVYRALVAVAKDAEEKKECWKAIATLCEGDLDDLDGAFEAYRELIALDPKDIAILRRMAALSERAGRVDELSRVLECEAQLAERADDRAQAFLRLATLRKDRLGDLEGAVAAYSQALQARRDDPGAIAGLAAILRDGGQARPLAAAALAPVYLGLGAFPEYIGCLEAQAAAARTSAEKKALLLRVAEVYEERLGRPEHAFTYSCRAFHEDLADGEIRARVERLAAQNGLFEDLAAFYLDEIDGVADHALGLAFRRRVADIYDQQLKDVDRAIAEHNRVLDVSPGDPEALKALERLYRAKGSFQSLAEVYRRRIAQSDDDTQRAHLLREFSRLQADALKDGPGAIATLRRLLDIEPNDVPALQRLAKLCGEQGRASELADVLARLISAAPEGSAAGLEAKYDLARLKGDKLGDLAGAEVLFREILATDPRDERTREYLQERLENAVADEDHGAAESTGEMLAEAMRAAGDWGELISVLRVLAQIAPSAFERVRMNREVATVYREKLEKPRLAFDTLAEVLKEAPGLEEVRSEFEQLAEGLGLFKEFVQIFEAALLSMPDSELALLLERRIARVVDARLGDKERAAAAWQRVLSHAPADPEALEAMDRLNQALGRWGALADVLEKRIELAQGDDEACHALLLRYAVVWDERLGEKGEAVEAYRRARALKPRDRETLLGLSRLIDPTDPEAAPELFAVLEALHDTSQNPREAQRLLPRLASLAGGPLGRRGAAIDLWRKVLTHEPTNTEALKGLEHLYEEEARWEELAHHLERQLQVARDEKEVLRLQRRIGFVKGVHLGSLDEAVKSWSEILRRNPNDVEALMSLRRIYREGGRWQELVATLRKLIPLQLDADGVKNIRFELADVYFTNLNMREEAIESAKRVLDVDPHTDAELMRLEEIFVATGAFGEAVKVMNARVELRDHVSEKIDILFDVAAVYETKIGRRAGAASAYERILSLEPTSLKAHEALAAIYEGNGDYRKLVELYNRRLNAIEVADERRKILFAIIDIQERWLGQPELAFSAACRAFAEEGADDRAQEIAERLAEETGNWDVLAEVFEEQIENVGVSRGLDLRRRLGEILLDKVKDEERAEEQLLHVLSSRPDDAVTRALLVRLYESQGRWKDLVGQLQEELELSPDIHDKRRLFQRIAEIEEREVGDIEAAIASTKRILDLDPEDDGALSELARMFRSVSRWHPLLGVLQRQLDRATTQKEKIAFRFEMAAVWETGIEDAEHAIEGYRDVLALDDTHLASLKALERIFTQGERWTELVEVYERQVRLATHEAEAIQLLARIAAIHEEEFRDLDAASATLIRVLEINPEHIPTVKSLERIWRQAGDWERLIEAYERHIELTEEATETVELYVAIGEIYVKELGKSEEAEAAFLKAVERDARSRPALHALGQLYERGGNWYNALEMLEREAQILGADPEAVEIYFRTGKINEDTLMDRDASKRAYGRALELDPTYVPALRALRHLLEDEGNYEEAVELQAQEAEVCEDREERASLYQHAAETFVDELDRVEEAVRLYEKSLEAKSDHVPSLRALGEIHFGDGEWERAERLLERLVERLDRHDDLEELVKQNYRLAYIAEKLDDDHRALKRYLASYELDSTYLPTLEGLAAALLRAERWEDAQRIFQTILIHHKGSLTDAEVVDLHYQLGELSVKLKQLERAKKSFDKALDLDSNHVPTLRAYARLSESLEQWEDAYDLRERLIVQLEEDDKLEELVAQAVLCRDKIREPYRAIDAYCEARRIRPDEATILRPLIELFKETSQTARTLEALEDLARLAETDIDARNVLFELAMVQWEEEKNGTAAVDALNRALDKDPMFVKAFEKIEQILGETKSWTLLEENYHRMINRIPKEQKPARIVLWTSLGELYQRVLKNDDGAKVAFDVVHKLAPDDFNVAMRLADLLAKKRDTAPKAVELYHRYLAAAPDPAPPTRRLFELYSALGQLDRAFSALGALLLMRAATADEEKAYHLLLKKAPAAAKRSLTDSLWRTVLLDPACRNSLADISSILYRGAPALFGAAQKGLQLKKKERVDLGDTKNPRIRLRYFDVWQRLANAMHVGDMDHYHRQGVAHGPRLYPGAPAVLYVGEGHEAFKELPPRQIAWLLARQMACARPELALARALAPEDAAAAIEAAIRFYVPEGSGVDLSVDPRLVAEWQKVLRYELRDQERALKALRDPVVTCLEKREMRHLGKFLEGAEHSVNRAALLMAGDVQVVDRGLNEGDPLVEVSFRARVRSLILFTMSEDYFALREKLGLAIAGPT